MPRSKNSWIDLPDINVWLALVFDGHVHHPRAAKWFEEVFPGGAAFCRITQMGLLRLVTNPQVMNESVLSMAGAWKMYDRLCADDRLVFLAEKESVEKAWRGLTRSSTPETKTWTDSYLAAFALAYDLRLVSFDRGFEKIRELRCLVLQ